MKSLSSDCGCTIFSPKEHIQIYISAWMLLVESSTWKGKNPECRKLKGRFIGQRQRRLNCPIRALVLVPDVSLHSALLCVSVHPQPDCSHRRELVTITAEPHCCPRLGPREWSRPRSPATSWDGPPSECPRLCAGKNSRASPSKVKAGLFREMHIPQRECEPSQKVRGAPVYGVVSFYGLGDFIG